MGDDFKLLHNGTCQTERMPEALKDDYVLIDERSLKDFVHQMAEFAKGVCYYNFKNEADGNWSAFFEEIYDYENKKVRFDSIDDFKEKASLSPHLALFVAFLKLFEIVQHDLNNLGKKHIEFYYKDLLRFEQHKAKPDNLCLFFKLNQKTNNVSVPKGTEFLVGKDSKGKAYRFVSKNDLLVNTAKINKLHNVTKEESNCVLIISSKYFRLKDGIRKICFYSNDDSYLERYIKSVEYTCEKGWYAMKHNINSGTDSWEAGISDPEFSDYNESVHKTNIAITEPALHIVIDADKIKGAPRIFNKISIEVKDSSDFSLSNKYGPLGTVRGLKPFGPHPSNGDFMRIDTVSGIRTNNKNECPSELYADIKWKDSDLSLTKYYSSYHSNSILNAIPDNVKDILKNLPGVTKELLKNNKKNKKVDTKNITLKDCIEKLTDNEWVLKYDLAHDVYNYLYAVALTKNNDLLLPPINPEIKTMHVRYKRNIASDSEDCNIFQILPSGYNKMEKSQRIFKMQSGQVYIGIKGIAAAQVLSMYVKFTGPVKNNVPENVSVWEYYDDDNNWYAFPKKDIIKDTTRQGMTDGVVYLKMPDDINMCYKTQTGDDNVWIRLVYTETGISRKIDEITPQVVETEYKSSDEEKNNAVEVHIPAGTQVNVPEPIYGIKKVFQLYPSYGGQASETDDAFRTRVSERLRHKGRAWNIWDYERLVLEEFPQVYRVKCLPYTGVDESGNVFESPGNVLLILFPKNGEGENILKPELNIEDILKIKCFVERRCSPFIKVFVQNAKFEEVKIKCNVYYIDGYDEILCNSRLNEDLKALFAPWIKNDAGINFKMEFYKSQILYFIEKLPYVDYIESLEISIGNYVFSENEKIRASSLNCVLTSAMEHDINNGNKC